MRILVDEEHKLVVVKFNNNKRYVIRCDERDTFDYRIGIGIALDRDGCYKNKKPLIEKLFKNKAAYYTFIYCGYFANDYLNEIAEKVKKEQADYKERLLKEQVRKYECELRGKKYKPNKITHKFIEL